MIDVTVAAIHQETPTVKSFRLDLAGQEFRYLPGQWLDCYADLEGRREVAGYSMTSSPLVEGSIELAVKGAGANPVTRFLHERARVGDTLHVDGGHGDIFYREEMGGPVALVAGGIGITPLMSIVRYIEQAAPAVRATLVHSARTPEELLFRQQLLDMERRSPGIRYHPTVTRPSGEAWAGLTGRIGARMLRDVGIGAGDLVYVCGPPEMVRSLLAVLEGLGVPDSRVRRERW